MSDNNKLWILWTAIETDDLMHVILDWEQQFLGFVDTTGYGWCIHAISLQAERPFYVEEVLQAKEDQWVRLSPLGTAATVWPIVPAPDDRWWLWSSRWNANWQGKPKYLEKTCPSATLSTTNPTWPDPGRRGGRPATNRLSYGTAQHVMVVWCVARSIVCHVMFVESFG
jgi:hypothetical protein